MRKREKISKRNIYDQMMEIERRTGQCPVWLIAGITKAERFERCAKHMDCEKCVQAWLNEEV